MSNEIAIISMPDANDDQIVNLTYALEAEGKLPFPIYITKARINTVNKKDILDWFETLAKISVEQGFGDEALDRLKNLKGN